MSKSSEDFVDKLAQADLSRLRSTIEAGLRDLFGGAISGVVSVIYCVSYAAFIFSGPLAPWLGYGIAATLISTTIGAFVVALRSSVPFTIAGPDSATSVVTATLVAALVEWLVANGAADHVLEPTLILMALSSALVGILLCGLGLARAGRAVRFVPYPVIGGFLGATGWRWFQVRVRSLQTCRLPLPTLKRCLVPQASLSSQRRQRLPSRSISGRAVLATRLSRSDSYWQGSQRHISLSSQPASQSPTHKPQAGCSSPRPRSRSRFPGTSTSLAASRGRHFRPWPAASLP